MYISQRDVLVQNRINYRYFSVIFNEIEYWMRQKFTVINANDL